MSILKKMEPFLNMSEILGDILSQLIESPIKSIKVECFGSIDELKPVLISFLKGIFSNVTDNRINFINAISVAEERGVSVSHSYSSEQVDYTNLVRAEVYTSQSKYSISGSAFSDSHARIVSIMGYGIDVFPEGVMLFMKNKDVPGVIGKIGTILGDNKINIASYILSRDNQNESAYSVVKVDENIDDGLIEKISKLDEIETINQIKLK